MTEDEQEALSCKYVAQRVMRLASGRFALFQGDTLTICEEHTLLPRIATYDELPEATRPKARERGQSFNPSTWPISAFNGVYPMTAERFQRLGGRVNIHIYHGNNYSYGKTQGMWIVNIEFTDDGTVIKQETTNAFLDDALFQAYEKLDRIVSKGIGASAMLPALEAPKEAF